MTHLDPHLVRGGQQDLLAAARHSRLAQAAATRRRPWRRSTAA